MGSRKRVPKPDCEPCILGESPPIEQSGIVIDKIYGEACQAALNSALKALTDDHEILFAAIHAPGLPSWHVFQFKAVFWYRHIAQQAGAIAHYDGGYIEYLKSVDEANGLRPKEYQEDYFHLWSRLWTIQDAATQLLANVGLHFGINCDSLFHSAVALRAFIKQLPTPAILFASVTQWHEDVIQRARIGREESVSRLMALDASAECTISQIEHEFITTEQESHNVDGIDYGYLDIGIDKEHRIVSRKNHRQQVVDISKTDWPLFVAMFKSESRGLTKKEAVNSYPGSPDAIREAKGRIKTNLIPLGITPDNGEWKLIDAQQRK